MPSINSSFQSLSQMLLLLFIDYKYKSKPYCSMQKNANNFFSGYFTSYDSEFYNIMENSTISNHFFPRFLQAALAAFLKSNFFKVENTLVFHALSSLKRVGGGSGLEC